MRVIINVFLIYIECFFLFFLIIIDNRFVFVDFGVVEKKMNMICVKFFFDGIGKGIYFVFIWNICFEGYKLCILDCFLLIDFFCFSYSLCGYIIKCNVVFFGN